MNEPIEAAPPKTETTTDQAIKDAHVKIEELLKFINWLQKHKALLDLLPFQPVFVSNHCDFDCLPHDGVLQVIKAFNAGKWLKTPNGEATVDYETEIDGMIVRCWHGEPPPSCKIVEEQVLVPARLETVRKLVCPKGEVL